MGLIGLGVPPSGEEVGRIFIFLVASIFYGGVWLALALVFSTVFRQPATAAMASIAVWLFYTIFWGILADLVSQALSPIQYGLPQEIIAQATLAQGLARLSPITLYTDAILALMQPALRSLGLILPIQMQGAVLGAPLPLRESVLLIWPQLTGLIAATILLFALAYVLFQRQEIRA